MKSVLGTLFEVWIFRSDYPHAINKNENDLTFAEKLIYLYIFYLQMYTKISSKVVGLLIAAKKRGLVYFEGEMLFQVSFLPHFQTDAR